MRVEHYLHYTIASLVYTQFRGLVIPLYVHSHSMT